jgi:hypothetical protein
MNDERDCAEIAYAMLIGCVVYFDEKPDLPDVTCSTRPLGMAGYERQLRSASMVGAPATTGN